MIANQKDTQLHCSWIISDYLWSKTFFPFHVIGQRPEIKKWFNCRGCQPIFYFLYPQNTSYFSFFVGYPTLIQDFIVLRHVCKHNLPYFLHLWYKIREIMSQTEQIKILIIRDWGVYRFILHNKKILYCRMPQSFLLRPFDQSKEKDKNVFDRR